MRLIESLKKRKFILFNIFLTLYIGVNLVGGERGLVSYYEKNKIQKNLIGVEINLSRNLDEIERKIKLLSTNIDPDYIDTIYREQFKFGKKDEIIIKLQ